MSCVWALCIYGTGTPRYARVCCVYNLCKAVGTETEEGTSRGRQNRKGCSLFRKSYGLREGVLEL